ncbi:MAG: tRNA (adenosine(37)-N6)-threonylcarbamoyltransferase complex ATPase subunit type 1 TsaE [Gammaproteobacteria bacterium]|nr:tRNA (adenosine(37)-N6)-threonylcarbamoyltransferase complex ATPase subunit type 1 TsaE [Gammaproteobacteria bacterium]
MASIRLTLDDEAATLRCAGVLAACAQPGMLLLLEGPLAAGKTTFARGFLRALGHLGQVKSPTFTVVESYYLPCFTVHHFDLYRINDPDELHYLGFDDFLAGDALCLIEWPSRAAHALPSATVAIHWQLGVGESREITLECGDENLYKTLHVELKKCFISVL